MTIRDIPIAVRRALPTDAEKLAVLGAATFSETFGHLYPPEDLQSFLTNSHSTQAWHAMLSDPQQATWVAELADKTLVGFIHVGPCKLPVPVLETGAGEVRQLYVLARYHDRRLGTRLMDDALAWLAAQGRSPLYVGVWSENYGAQRFYARYGFVKVGEYGFQVGSTVDHEFILKR